MCEKHQWMKFARQNPQIQVKKQDFRAKNVMDEFFSVGIFFTLREKTIFLFYTLAHFTRNKTIELIFLVSLQSVDSIEWNIGIHMLSSLLKRNIS